MFKAFKKAKLYILAIPFLLILLGAAANQAVVAANHDTFPVMVNDARLANDGINCANGKVCMIDQIHSVMTPSTHLNFLADWIDLQSAIYSPGDLLLMLGDFLLKYAPLVWAFCMIQLALTGKLRNS